MFRVVLGRSDREMERLQRSIASVCYFPNHQTSYISGDAQLLEIDESDEFPSLLPIRHLNST